MSTAAGYMAIVSMSSSSSSSSSSLVDILPQPMLELALSCLPDLRSILSASSTCKLLRSLISSPHFLLLHSLRHPASPWLFAFGLNRLLPSLRNQSFALDPISFSWIRLPPLRLHPPPFSGFNLSSLSPSSRGGLFALLGPNQDRLCIADSLLKPDWRAIEAPMEVPRDAVGARPLVAAVAGGSKIVVAGGAGEELEVEVYEEARQKWRRCQPMGRATSVSMAVSDPESRVYVADRCSGHACWMDVAQEDGRWESVVLERPAGARWWSLLWLTGVGLVAVVLCGRGAVKLLKLDKDTMHVDAELGTMPGGLFRTLWRPEDESSAADMDGTLETHASMSCTGAGDLIYIYSTSSLFFNEHGPRVVMCRVSDAGVCSWAQPPGLSGRVNRFDRVLWTSSHVSLASCLTLP